MKTIFEIFTIISRTQEIGSRQTYLRLAFIEKKEKKKKKKEQEKEKEIRLTSVSTDYSH